MESVPVYENENFLGDLVLVNGDVRFEPNSLHSGFPIPDVKNYLANALPEGERDRWYKALRHLPSETLVGYMQRYGEDLAGSLSCGVRNEALAAPKDVTDEVAALIAEDAPLDAVIKGQKSLLSGADPKMAVILEGGRLFLPDAEHPSTHVLKYGNRLCLNEHFCMSLMRNVGIPAAVTELSCISGHEVLIVRRFDRMNGRRLFAADFCQLLGRGAGEKYRVTWPEIGACLDEWNISEKDRKHLFDMALFCIILGCSDDHAKNISLVGELPGPLSLAPAYDVASMVVARECSRAYANIDLSMPRAIGCQHDRHKLKEVHFRMLAETLGLDPAYAAERFPVILDAIGETGPVLLDEIADAVRDEPFQEKDRRLHTAFFEKMRCRMEKEVRFFSKFAGKKKSPDTRNHAGANSSPGL